MCPLVMGELQKLYHSLFIRVIRTDNISLLYLCSLNTFFLVHCLFPSRWNENQPREVRLYTILTPFYILLVHGIIGTFHLFVCCCDISYMFVFIYIYIHILNVLYVNVSYFRLFHAFLTSFSCVNTIILMHHLEKKGRTHKRHPLIIFTNPSARAGHDTRSIFKQSLTGLNSEFSFS